MKGRIVPIRSMVAQCNTEQCKISCHKLEVLAFMLQVWLPIRLIQNRVENEIKNNLAAVRRHSEALHRRQGSTQRF